MGLTLYSGKLEDINSFGEMLRLSLFPCSVTRTWYVGYYNSQPAV